MRQARASFFSSERKHDVAAHLLEAPSQPSDAVEELKRAATRGEPRRLQHRHWALAESVPTKQVGAEAPAGGTQFG